MKNLVAAVSFAALLTAGGALAQTQTAPIGTTRSDSSTMPPAGTTSVPRPADPHAGMTTGTVAAGAAATAMPMTQGMLGTQFWKQGVYDPAQNRIGEVDDIVVNASGQITEAIIGVGGFLGIGEKNVAVPFSALKPMWRDGRVWFELSQTKEQLTAAPVFDGARYRKPM